MPKILNKQSLAFSDVHIISDRPSIVSSRNEINIDTSKIIAAPMGSIMGNKFVKAAIESGISVPIHRFNTPDEQHKLLELAISIRILLNSQSNLWISVGINDFDERIKPVHDMLLHNNVGVLLDVANGFSVDVKKALETISSRYGVKLFGGNIHSVKGFVHLEDAGCSRIRCGIGGGMACSTTDKTGVGKGQFSVISELVNELNTDALIVSDGGIRSPGDLAKAFGAGADEVMIGGYFASALEAECNQEGCDGTFYGGASATAKRIMGLPVKNVEGKEISVNPNKLKPLSELVKELTEGLKSAISYSGYSSLDTYIGGATFQIKKL